MPARLISLTSFFACCICSALSTNAASPNVGEYDRNWPQWRGPLSIGVAPDAHPPVQWSESKNVKWKVPIPGSGSSTPIVWNDKVFVQTAIATGIKPTPAGAATDASAALTAPASPSPPAGPQRGGRGPGGPGGAGGMGSKPDDIYQFVLLCLDRATGHELWRSVLREEVPHEGIFVGNGSFASASPVTDGQRVYAFFGSRGLYCLDLEGHKLWEKDLGKMQVRLSFGEGSSPALYENTLIVNWDHEGQSFIVALDKRSGDEIWRMPRDEKTSWTTPLVIVRDGTPQVVTAATSKIRSYDLASGKLLWECAGLTANSIPSPVVDGDLVYATTGFRGSVLLAIRLGASGDLTDSDSIAWKYDKDTPYVPSPLVYDGRLYVIKVNTQIISCLDAKTGKVLFGPQRLEGMGDIYASPVGAAGRVYFVGRNGTTAVIKAADSLEVQATNVLDDPIDASPALVDNELFLRGKDHLYCIAEK